MRTLADCSVLGYTLERHDVAPLSCMYHGEGEAYAKAAHPYICCCDINGSLST